MSEIEKAIQADDYVVVAELADELQVRKQTILRIAKRLGIRLVKRREAARGNQLVSTAAPHDIAAIRTELWSNTKPSQSSAAGSDLITANAGVFYVIQLEPDHDPGRFKVGFTTDIDGRLRKHRCSAPFAVCSKHWPCRRTWERAAMDCITDGLEQLHTEVFRCDAIADILRRGDGFFEVMPAVECEPDTEDDEALFPENGG